MRTARALALASCLCACAQSAPVAVAPTTAEWQEARTALGELRRRYRQDAPYRMNMTVVLEQKALGHHVRGRGAVAVRPARDGAPGAMRMIVLGPAGTTAMDLWICGEAFRFEVPAAELVRRGDATSGEDRLHGLPVRFLRWWFLDPLAGDLLSYDEREGVPRWVLRDGSAVIEVRQPSSASLRVRRRGRDEEETLESSGAEACNRVSYEQSTSGVALEVTCEEIARRVPAQAFADPDGEAGCLAPPPLPGELEPEEEDDAEDEL
jgi:hypothetical protein